MSVYIYITRCSISSSLLSLFSSALKKEIEQIESGELEGELPALWEKLQA